MFRMYPSIMEPYRSCDTRPRPVASTQPPLIPPARLHLIYFAQENFQLTIPTAANEANLYVPTDGAIIELRCIRTYRTALYTTTSFWELLSRFEIQIRAESSVPQFATRSALLRRAKAALDDSSLRTSHRNILLS